MKEAPIRIDEDTGIWTAKVPAGAILRQFMVGDRGWVLCYDVPEPEDKGDEDGEV